MPLTISAVFGIVLFIQIKNGIILDGRWRIWFFKINRPLLFWIIILVHSLAFFWSLSLLYDTFHIIYIEGVING